MNKRPWLKRIAAGALLGGLLLGSVGFAYAADSSSVADTVGNVKTKFQSMVPGGRGNGHGMMGEGMGMNLNLQALVKEGLITNDESTAIQTKINAQQAERQAEMAKVKAMTAEERQAYFQANQPTRGNCLAELVSAGTITQEQADALQQAIGGPRGEGKGPGGMGHGGMGRGGHGGMGCGSGCNAVQ